MRASEAPNPMSPSMSSKCDLTNRILSNSVEQVILFLLSTFIMASYLREDQMKSIPILIIYWAIGRMLFAYG